MVKKKPEPKVEVEKAVERITIIGKDKLNKLLSEGYQVESQKLNEESIMTYTLKK